MQHERTSVLIVGGGPVGLASAMFLARQGVQPILVERRWAPSTTPRATGLHARTLELFREAGLEARTAELGMEMVGAGRQAERVRARRATPTVMLGAESLGDIDNAVVLESYDIDYEGLTPSRPIWCGQDLYEPLLLGEAQRRGADVRFGVECRSFTQDGEGVSALVRDRRTGEETTIRASYLIAADGVHSPIRHALGVGHRSNGDAGDVVTIIFRARIDLPETAPAFTWFVIFHPDVIGLLLVMGVDRWMLSVIEYSKRGLTPADFTPERCLQLIRTTAGVPDLEAEIESAKPWQAVHMVADEFRVGRVLLAGDACHAHPPSGGFGVNAGIHDVHNLAWKLAAVLQGWAGEGLLSTYDVERRPVGAATADQAWLLTKARSGGLSDQEREQFRDILSVTLGYRYHSTAIDEQDDGTAEVVPRELDLSGRPGSRLPHLWLERAGVRLSSIDLVEGTFTLVAGPDGRDWALAAGRAADTLGVPLRRHQIGGGDLVDVEGRWQAACGVSDSGALLVRPDGFVAWRAHSSDTDPEGILGEVLGRILGRTSPVGALAGRP